MDLISMQGVFKAYECISGQSINFDKSSIAFSSNVDMNLQRSLAEVLGIRRVSFHYKYLGLPVTMGRSKVNVFRFLVDRVKRKTESWSAKVLSAVGREVLLKTVAQAIPAFFMNCFEIPDTIISELHGVFAKYWWSRDSSKKRMHWCSWSKLCENKDSGGLGFRDLKIFNLALLAKQGWRLHHNPESMVARILKAKYYPRCTFMEARITHNASFTWRSIVSGRRVLEAGTRYRIGRGESVSFFHDRWLPMPFNFKTFTRPPDGSDDLQVSFFIDHDSGGWREALLREFFSDYEADLILKLPICYSQRHDTLMWHFDKYGDYSVKSGYWVYKEYMLRLNIAGASSSSAKGTQQLWKSIWSLHVPPKVRLFAWKVANAFIPTRTALARRHVDIGVTDCVLCGGSEETLEHLLRDCSVTKHIWREGELHGVVDVMFQIPFIEWLHAMVVLLDKSQLELFFMILWSIWYYRNKYLWENGEFSTGFIVSWSSNKLEEYRRANTKSNPSLSHNMGYPYYSPPPPPPSTPCAPPPPPPCPPPPPPPCPPPPSYPHHHSSPPSPSPTTPTIPPKLPPSPTTPKLPPSLPPSTPYTPSPNAPKVQPPLPPTPSKAPSPSPRYKPKPPRHQPPKQPWAPTPYNTLGPDTPYYPIAPGAPYYNPIAPSLQLTPKHHNSHRTMYIATFVSLGGVFLLGFIALGLFCMAKKKRRGYGAPAPPPPAPYGAA